MLNISEIQKKRDDRRLKIKTIEKEAQTDLLNNEFIERGTQTNKELVKLFLDFHLKFFGKMRFENSYI